MSKRPKPPAHSIIPLVGDSSGQVEDVPGLLGLARSGTELRLPRPEELIPLPPGADLQFLPGRRAVALEPDSGDELTLGDFAVACRLPAGYTRTLLPAFDKDDEVEDYLPFFGYTAVFAHGDDLVCGAVQTDTNPHWHPDCYHNEDLPTKIEAMHRMFPDNRILKQLETCALEYGCYNAQNIFEHRWEGAVTVSPACNAQCRGCISLQPEELPPSPQERFRFKGQLEEIIELGSYHLTSPESIFSFGQGCEGEPLLAGDVIADAVKVLSKIEGRGTIHLNSNASLPEKVQKIVDAGLDSLRVSTNSVLSNIYEAYYQPRRYKFEALRESTLIARRAGCHVSLNLLMVPGWIDVEEEVDALVEFVVTCGVNMIQLRTLNIDPDFYANYVPKPKGKAIGIPAFIDRLKADCPGLTLGNHSPRVHRGSAGIFTN